MQDVKRTQALRRMAELEELGTLEQAPTPSWASNFDEQQEFVAMLVVDMRRKNIPDAFFLDMWNNEIDRGRLLGIAGFMEENNSSFIGQSIAVADIITHAWSKLPNAERQIFLNNGHRIQL